MRGSNVYLNNRKIPLTRPALPGDLTARALLVATPRAGRGEGSKSKMRCYAACMRERSASPKA